MKKELVRGIRNKNPLNLEWGSPWAGLLPKEKRTDRRFCQFESFFYGYRAALILLSRTYKRRGWTTIQKIIQHFAPAPENNVEAYIEYVWKRTGITPKEQIQKPRAYYDIVKAMAQYECGSLPDPDDLTEAYNSLMSSGAVKK